MTNCVWIEEPLRTSCLIPLGVAFGFLTPVAIMILHFWLKMSNSMAHVFRGFSAAICKVIVSDCTAVFHTLYFLMGSFIFSSVSRRIIMPQNVASPRGLCRRLQVLSHKVCLVYQSMMLLAFATHTELHVIYVINVRHACLFSMKNHTFQTAKSVQSTRGYFEIFIYKACKFMFDVITRSRR